MYTVYGLYFFGQRCYLPPDNPEFMDELQDDSTSFFECLRSGLRVGESANLVKDLIFQKAEGNLDFLCGMKETACDLVERHMEASKDLRKANEILKTDLIDRQKDVISLQTDLLKSKADEVSSLRAEVTTAGWATVASRPAPVKIPPKALQTAVRSIVQEEDRSKNLMVFGLKEEKDEDLSNAVSGVLEELGGKARVEAVRLGTVRSDGKPRPIRVKLSSSSTVHQLLRRAKELRGNETYKSVFLSPDRNTDDRKRHKRLVEEL